MATGSEEIRDFALSTVEEWLPGYTQDHPQRRIVALTDPGAGPDTVLISISPILDPVDARFFRIRVSVEEVDLDAEAAG